MVNPVTGAGNGADAAQALYRSGQVADAAGAMIDSSRQLGVVNAELLARELVQVVQQDPRRAADLLAAIKPQLSAADQRALTRELAEQLDARAANNLQAQTTARTNDVARQQRELALDLVQIGLSIAGIFDPTPVSDGLDGLISLFRGDLLGAGISVVSMVPYLGDAAKLGKLGKFAETIARAVDLAKADAAFARQIEPALQQIRRALDSVPLDSLPRPAREALESMKTKIDELFSAGRTISRNGYDYHLDAQGRVTRVEGDLVLNRTNTRNQRAQLEAGGADRLPNDQGGHYIARIFNGPVDDFNHFAQNGNFNMGAYRSLERQWDQLLQGGHSVRVEIRPHYSGDSLRPDRLTVNSWVDGVRQDPVIFRNAPGGR